MEAPGSFLQAYNVHRYAGQAPLQGGPQTPKASLMRQIATHAQPQLSPRDEGPATGRPAAQPGVLNYRSDMEEEGLPPKAQPCLGERPALGVRRRSLHGVIAMRVDTRMTGCYAWVESFEFQACTAIAIVLNAIIIGLETDIKSLLWWYGEQALLAFFVLELGIRLARTGPKFFSRQEEDWAWNLFDFTIVISGVFDQWVIAWLKYSTTIFNARQHHKLGVVFMLMRMGRLLRIIRLFRLGKKVKLIRPLYELAQGVMEALQGMFWVLVFMVMTLYAAAIICTRLIGHGDALSEEILADVRVREIQLMFSTLENSMFTLFGTVSSWSLKKFTPLFADMPWLRPFFVLFYVYTSWALLAIMTGVVSENMVAIREQILLQEGRKKEFKKTMVTQMLEKILREGDADKNRSVTWEEFQFMLEDQSLNKKLKANVHMRKKDLTDLFRWLDSGETGVITIDSFMAGFKWVNEPLSSKTMMKLKDRLARDVKTMGRSVTQLVEDKVNEAKQLVGHPLRKINAITEQLQALDGFVSDTRGRVTDSVHRVPTQQSAERMESRINARIAAVEDSLLELERQLQQAISAIPAEEGSLEPARSSTKSTGFFTKGASLLKSSALGMSAARRGEFALPPPRDAGER